ncbi:hypothetical protein AAFC00_006425 [Neodothiora populina]|uniref:Uncharacterized protein n=1 Tax=Neodothiora populina TaxID=2781224 RepID=A0ABR3P593_9PEZI
MRLHILGPAFGLPSIDAECIAAVALVKSYCESIEKPWELIASHEAPQGAQLPFLVEDNVFCSGFSSIARHLTDESGHISGLAVDLSSEQRADAIALTSFITSAGLALLDISLYVSFENYRLRTRSSYTQILPWYSNFLLPPRIRAAARTRTTHLGVSSIDIDTVHDDVIEKPASLQQQPRPFEEHETEKHAKRLLGQRKSVLSLLRTPEHAAAFKVKALADNFFDPLRETLGNKQYLLGTSAPSVVDCLAFGYLSLMLYPRMPQAWLETSLKTQNSKLKLYIDRLRARFDMDATPPEAFCKNSPNVVGAEEAETLQERVVASKLPWTQPQELGIAGAVSYLGREIQQHLPLPNSGAQVKHLPEQDYKTGWLGKTIPYLPALGVAALASYWLYLDRPWPRGEAMHYFGKRTKLTDLGAAGALLGGLSFQMQSPQFETKPREIQEYDNGAVQVEVIENETAV